MNGQPIFNVQNAGQKVFNLDHESGAPLNPENLDVVRQASATSQNSLGGANQLAQIPLKSMQPEAAQMTSISQVNPVPSMQLLQANKEPVPQPSYALSVLPTGLGGGQGDRGWIDAIDAPEETLRELLKSERPLRFDWENKWLRGDQYAHMLNNIDAYRDAFGMHKMAEKQHPENIYLQPQNGQVYFVRANSIGSDFGFPRLGIKKKYKWKKMNFTTDLPKRNPLVSYIVASAVRCEKFFPGQSKNGGPVYRMHAVILKTNKPARGTPASQQAQEAAENANQKKAGGHWNPQDDSTGGQKDKPLYICCHVRRVELGQDDNDDSGGGKAASESQQKTQLQKQASIKTQDALLQSKRSLLSQQPQSGLPKASSAGLDMTQLDLNTDGLFKSRLGVMKDLSPSNQLSQVQHFITQNTLTSQQQQQMHQHHITGGFKPSGLSHQSSSGSKKDEIEQFVTGSKRPRRQATLKQHKDDSQDPYIYTSTTKIAQPRRTKPQAQAASQQKSKRGPKQGSTRGAARRAANLAPPADFGARLFSSLKADISSDETGGRRRRAYTDVADLLAEDIKQGEQQATSEAELGRQRSNPFSDRNSTSRTKKQQLSEMGGDSKGRVSITINLDPAAHDPTAKDAQAVKKREAKQQEKQATSIRQTLLKSLGPQESPIVGPLTGKFSAYDRRKFSLDMDHKEKVRNQDLKNLVFGKFNAYLDSKQQGQTTRRAALGIKSQPKRKILKPGNSFNRKEFVSPKPVGNEVGRSAEFFKNVSPMLMPQWTTTMVDPDDQQQNGLRRRSSQIISADQSFKEGGPQPGGREREDSITAFKKFEKQMIPDYNFHHPTQRMSTSPMLSPSIKGTPNVPTPLQVNNQLLGASPLQNSSIQALLFQSLGSQGKFVLPGQQITQLNTQQMLSAAPQFQQLGTAGSGTNNSHLNNLGLFNQLAPSPLMQPSLPKTMFNLAANQNLLNPTQPFRQANRNSFLELTGAGTSSQMPPRGSFSGSTFGLGGDMLDSVMGQRVGGMMLPSSGINELLQNQMPGHKMSLDFSSSRQPDHK